MRVNVCAAALMLLCLPLSIHAQRASEVDPMLGADGGGNVFIGPTVPYGMAKPGPDYGNNEGNAECANAGPRGVFGVQDQRDDQERCDHVQRGDRDAQEEEESRKPQRTIVRFVRQRPVRVHFGGLAEAEEFPRADEVGP